MDTPTWDSTQPVETQASTHAAPEASTPDSGEPSWDNTFDPQEKYGTTGQQALAGIEGIGRGVAGPVTTFVEKEMLRVPEEDIKGREEANPITAGVGEAVGLGGSMLTGTGEGALLGKVGEAAAGLTEAGKAAQAAKLGLEGVEAAKAADAALQAQPLINRVGSSAVQQAAEMAVLQSGNEIHKMILNEPDKAGESAIANIGLASALGAGTGAFITGAVSPLWKATGEPALGSILSKIHGRLSGEPVIKPSASIAEDLGTLGVEASPLQKADLSDDVKAGKYIKDLTRGENTDILAEKDDLRSKVANSVMEPLGTNLEEMQVYDNHQAGQAISNKLKSSIKKEFEPIWNDLDKRDAEAALLSVADEDRLHLRDKILERGLEKSAGNNSIYKIYQEAGDQLLNHETIRGFDIMDSQLYKSAKNFSQDANLSDAQRDIRSMLKEFKNTLIEKSAAETERLGVGGAKKAGAELLAERAAVSQRYAKAEAIREELGEHFGITKPDNARQFMKALDEALTPEQVLKKFSIKDNMDGAKFLAERFPEVFQDVIKNEQKALLKPAIVAAAKKGDVPIDVKKLMSIITTAKGGKSQYLDTVLPKEFIERAEAASRVLEQTTKAKDSGTPAGMLGVLRGIGTSALASVGWMTGHGIGSSALLAELAARGGHALPEAYKLGYLKFMASDTPVNATGFKAMVDFMHNVVKGETMLNKSAKAVFDSGSKVIMKSIPQVKGENEKLDKMVEGYRTNPEGLQQKQNGQTGHYLPDHQMNLSKSTTGAMAYLESIKPKGFQAGPLDKPIEPSKAELDRYNRALTIANDPTVVLNHVKHGTIQVSDIQDLKAMYPALYTNMADKLTHELMTMQANHETIPYSTKMGLSLFLGQPIDSSMSPSSIMAAQPKPKAPPPQGTQPKAKGSSLKGLGKSNSMYQTPGQASEAHRNAKE